MYRQRTDYLFIVIFSTVIKTERFELQLVQIGYNSCSIMKYISDTNLTGSVMLL